MRVKKSLIYIILSFLLLTFAFSILTSQTLDNEDDESQYDDRMDPDLAETPIEYRSLNLGTPITSEEVYIISGLTIQELVAIVVEKVNEVLKERELIISLKTQKTISKIVLSELFGSKDFSELKIEEEVNKAINLMLNIGENVTEPPKGSKMDKYLWVPAILIGEDKIYKETITNGEDTLITIVVRSVEGRDYYGNIKMYAYNIETMLVYPIFSMKKYALLNGYGQIQFLWDGKILNSESYLSSGKYKIFADFNVYKNDVNEKAFKSIRRVWGLNFPFEYYQLTIKDKK